MEKEKKRRLLTYILTCKYKKNTNVSISKENIFIVTTAQSPGMSKKEEKQQQQKKRKWNQLKLLNTALSSIH